MGGFSTKINKFYVQKDLFWGEKEKEGKEKKMKNKEDSKLDRHKPHSPYTTRITSSHNLVSVIQKKHCKYIASFYS